MRYKVEFTNSKDVERQLNKISKDISLIACESANRDCLYIAQAANFYTAKSSETKIRADMNKVVYGNNITMGEMLVNQKRKQKGLGKIKGILLKNQINELIKAKIASITYLKSGWLPSIRILRNFIKTFGDITFTNRYQYKIDATSKQKGKDKGFAFPARPSASGFSIATIGNTAGQGKRYESAKRVLDLGLQTAYKLVYKNIQKLGELRLLEYVKKNRLN